MCKIVVKISEKDRCVNKVVICVNKIIIEGSGEARTLVYACLGVKNADVMLRSELWRYETDTGQVEGGTTSAYIMNSTPDSNPRLFLEFRKRIFWTYADNRIWVKWKCLKHAVQRLSLLCFINMLQILITNNKINIFSNLPIVVLILLCSIVAFKGWNKTYFSPSQ